MTILHDLPANRCPLCGLHPDPDVMGHRAVDSDGQPTGCTPSGVLGLQLGRQQRDEGMDRTTDAHPDDAALVDSVLEARIRRGGEWSLNDLRPQLAEVKAKAVIGARVQAFARAKRIIRIGYVPSTDVGTHGHPVALWRAAA